MLLKDKHVSSNDADHWQQFLHQHHLSVILPIHHSLRFNKNETGITEFQYRNRDITELLKAGCVHRRWLVLMLCCWDAKGADARAFSEFL